MQHTMLIVAVTRAVHNRESGGMTNSVPKEVFRGSIDRILAKVEEERGIDLSLYRRAYVERRLNNRLRKLNLPTFRQYAELLDREPSEYDRLMDTLTINVTQFFRDDEVWKVIKSRVMRDLVDSKCEGRSRTIRLWSAGCATGQEAYSLAMVLLDVLGPDASRFLISVTATDLDPIALEKAECGVYDVQQLEHIPRSYRMRFLEHVDESTFRIGPEVREIVRFGRLSLFDESPMRMVDLILCRNVFIYFDREQQAKVLENFTGSLVRGGYLILGRSEKLSEGAAAMLEPVDGRERVYRKPPR